jgi:hypothetical protein
MLRKLFCNGIIWCAILCFAGCAFLAAYTSLTANKENQNSESQTKNQMVMKMEETIFACNMAALRTKEKARYDVLIKQLAAVNPEVTELANGFVFHYPANSQNITDAAEFVAYERLCCPFLSFEILIEGEDLQLRLKGKEGVKEFIKMEFNL